MPRTTPLPMMASMTALTVDLTWFIISRRNGKSTVTKRRSSRLDSSLLLRPLTLRASLQMQFRFVYGLRKIVQEFGSVLPANDAVIAG